MGSSAAYYNEIDPYAAQWLRNLIAAGHIAPGDVDERSIEDVFPDDLRSYAQCHFFAGIGVWSYALRHAGWPDDRPVWTGSCPCQPFSQAGKGAAFDDERHLWPAFHHLIKKCRPAIVFGEQVASKDAGAWIDLVQDDLEGVGYAFGAVAFPASSVGAPHIRERTYWVADSGRSRLEERQRIGGISSEATEADKGEASERRGVFPIYGLGNADSDGTGRERRSFCGPQAGESGGKCSNHAFPPSDNASSGPLDGFWRDADWLLCRDGRWRPVEPSTFPLVNGAPSRVGRLRAYGNAICAPQAQAFIECAMEAING